jgi:LSD1 subclass zinc finger protein
MSILIVFWIIWTIIAVLIGQKKNIDLGTSLTLGLLLGLIGIVILLLMRTELPKTPKGMIAVKCSRCNTVQKVAMKQATFECKTIEPMSKAVRS